MEVPEKLTMSKMGLSVISASASENSEVSSSVSGAVNFISVFFLVSGDTHIRRA